MKHNFLSIAWLLVGMMSCYAQTVKEIQWTVVGAGPAGIAVVGLLLDAGIEPNQLAWIDAEFNVGRLGKYYENVPGNAKTRWYIDFLQACETFGGCKSEAIDKLYTYDLDTTYPLYVIVEPLRDITAYLRTKVISIQDELTALDFHHGQWYVGTKNHGVKSHNVVLATGSHPRTFNDYPNIYQIPLDFALDKSRLATVVGSDDTVGVIGSAHSAILLLKYLSEIGVARIMNFYKNPIVYPVDMGDWVLYQQAGLKGEVAQWAKNVLEKNPPANLVRTFSSTESLKAWLPICTKLIYACGFERNSLPPINGDPNIYDDYDSSSGMIAPRLFGVGIAFPEEVTDPQGNKEYAVGLKFFMEYIQKNIPAWLKKDRSRFYSFDRYFSINIL